MKIDETLKWRERANRCLPGGVNSQFRPDPVVFSRGRGSRVWDADGNEFIDFTLSQGPLIHGHSHPAILARVSESLARGQVWNGLHTDEIELAEKLVELVPCAEQIRLGCTGSEAAHAAIRLARACTGRPKVVKFEGHYHGWLDGVAGSINPPIDLAGPIDEPQCVPWTRGLAPGALDGLLILPWNDAAAVESAFARHANQIAAVITEPCMCNSGCIAPSPGFLESLRNLCTAHGSALIFDEVITGFRLSLGGAQQHYAVTPDLSVFGKAVANGFPLSVLAGRSEFMRRLGDGTTIHAGTLNAHVGCVAAAIESLRLLEANGGAAYEQLFEFGRTLMRELSELSAAVGQPLKVTGPGPVFHAGFVRADADDRPVRNYRDVIAIYDTAKYAKFVQSLASHGVRVIGRGIWYVSTAHSANDLDQTLDAVRHSLGEIVRA